MIAPKRKRPISLRDLLGKATQRLTGSQKRQRYPRSSSTEYHFDEAKTERQFRKYFIMADGEEDFSSLPLPDRFTHKVGLIGCRWAQVADLM